MITKNRQPEETREHTPAIEHAKGVRILEAAIRTHRAGRSFELATLPRKNGLARMFAIPKEETPEGAASFVNSYLHAEAWRRIESVVGICIDFTGLNGHDFIPHIEMKAWKWIVESDGRLFFFPRRMNTNIDADGVREITAALSKILSHDLSNALTIYVELKATR